MDKEILAVIGKLYLDLISLNNHIETQNQRIAELENRAALSNNPTNKKTN